MPLCPLCPLWPLLWPLTVVAIQAIAAALCAVDGFDAVHGLYAVDPLLILHFDPTLLERASLLAGRAYSVPPRGRQARNNGRRICGKIGSFERETRYRRGLILAISTSSRSSISASTESSRSSPELSLSSAVAAFSRCSVEGPGAPPRTSSLSSSSTSRAVRPRVDRAALSLGRVVLTLQREQGVDAADGAERSRRQRRLRRLALVDGETAGCGAARRGRVRDLAGGVRSVDAHELDLSAPSLGGRNAEASREYRQRWPGMVNRR